MVKCEQCYIEKGRYISRAINYDMNYDISLSAFRDIKYYLTNLTIRKVALYNCKYSIILNMRGLFYIF